MQKACTAHASDLAVERGAGAFTKPAGDRGASSDERVKVHAGGVGLFREAHDRGVDNARLGVMTVPGELSAIVRCAEVYERCGKLYVSSSSQTTTGLWIGNDAPILISSKDDVGEIGRSISQCLAASRQGVPHPTCWGNGFKPILDVAGVKSYRTFIQSAKLISVKTTGDTVTLTPWRNQGPKDGFVPLPDKSQIPFGSDEALGSAALAALARAE